MNEPVHVIQAEAAAPHAVAGDVAADDRAVEGARPGDGTQPPWQRDAVSISSRVRAILATLRPIAVRVLTFWDHAVRSIRVGNARLDIDPSGSYRMR